MLDRHFADADTDPDIAALLTARPHLRMHVVDGLTLEGVPLARVGAMVGTPAWVIGAGTIRARFARLRAALDGAGLDARIHYAVKANDHLAVLALLAEAGAGADVVSEGELRRARRAGIAAEHVVFSGIGKTEAELRQALEAGIGQINVESAEELAMLSALASAAGRVARVALRVNPDVDAGSHTKITTGRAEDKFGIPLPDITSLYSQAAALPGIAPVGLAVHIGSQILTMAPYRAAFGRIAGLVQSLRSAGHRVQIVDCGGGLGIGYRDEPEASPEALAGAIAATLGGLGLRLLVEPGRWLVGPAGLLLASVVRSKRAGMARPLIVLDAGMNELLRPALYDAWHGILPVAPGAAAARSERADIVGPVCESADIFGRDRALPPLSPGALVAILDAGAYGAVMSSTYNARPLAPAVLVDGEDMTVIRERQPVEALWAGEIIPGRATG